MPELRSISHGYFLSVLEGCARVLFVVSGPIFPMRTTFDRPLMMNTGIGFLTAPGLSADRGRSRVELGERSTFTYSGAA